MSFGFSALQFLLMAALLSVPMASAEARAPQWTCVYPTVANPAGAFKDHSLALTFNIDESGKLATVTGASGTHAVEVFAGTEGLTFIDRLKTGAIQVTTIDSSGKSVHSQHTLLNGLLVPSQSYGKCEAT